MLSYQDGSLLSEQRYFSANLLESLGGLIATLSKNIGTSGATTTRSTQWDMQQAYEVIQRTSHGIEDVRQRAQVLTACSEMHQLLSTHKASLRHQLVHADLAPYNLLCSTEKTNYGQAVLDGVIDFGDVCHSWLVAEIAIAATPLLLNAGNS